MLAPSSLPEPEALCRQFSLSDIISATKNFSSDLIIGKGSFGNVYKATITTGPGITTTVAVKRRNFNSDQGPQEFMTEVNLLSAFRHTHLISLIGYCVDHDSNEMILVYEYMANGTLADHIYKKNGKSSCLSWEQRLTICIGVGRGLEYLHTGTGISQIVIHRDLKSSNILLQADWAAKVSDFGLCKKFTGNQPDIPIIASVKGTRGYMDPHYIEAHELSTKTDVYAFGVVLLEVFCGRRSLDNQVPPRQQRLVPWAEQCIREGVVHRIIDPGLRGRIAEDGLEIFLDITLQCLNERPNKRPTMVEVVAKLEAALKSQYTSYSSSEDDEFIKIYFGNVAYSSSPASSDADSIRRVAEIGSGKSDVKQDPGSESYFTDVVGGSTHSTIAATSETSINLSEFDKLVRRMNPPRVSVDNESCENATVIEVNSTSTHGVLLELLQVLTDFDLTITKSSRTSDGPWFLDVFLVIDQEGNKVTDKTKIQNIQKALHVYSTSTSPMGRKCEERSIPYGHTTLEFIGNDRPGLISEVSAILSDLQCNVVTAEVWTHNTRLAAVMHVSDKETKSSIVEPVKLAKVKKYLLVVLKGGHENWEATIKVSCGCTWFDRKLHQIMFSDRYYETGLTLNDKKRQKVDVFSWDDNNYSVIAIRCKSTPKVLFDTICTLTDLKYFVFHGSFVADGPEAYRMDLWIRHIDGSPFKTDAERHKVMQYLEAAIERRISEGLKIEIRTKDRVGLLSDVTRIMRENSLNITRAEVSTTGDKAVFFFYLDDNLGYPVDPKIIDYVRKEIGQNILQVKGNRKDSYQVVKKRSDVLKTFLSWISFTEHQVSFLSK